MSGLVLVAALARYLVLEQVNVPRVVEVFELRRLNAAEAREVRALEDFVDVQMQIGSGSVDDWRWLAIGKQRHRNGEKG